MTVLARQARRLLLALAPALGACQSERAEYDAQGPRYEARAWLGASGNLYPFASNRFHSRAAAAAFIDSLYGLGADTVYVLDVQQDSATIRLEGGPYADAVLLRLPADAAVRRRLFAVQAREARREGFDPDPDRGQRYLYLWWD